MVGDGHAWTAEGLVLVRRPERLRPAAGAYPPTRSEPRLVGAAPFRSLQSVRLAKLQQKDIAIMKASAILPQPTSTAGAVQTTSACPGCRSWRRDERGST